MAHLVALVVALAALVAHEPITGRSQIRRAEGRTSGRWRRDLLSVVYHFDGGAGGAGGDRGGLVVAHGLAAHLVAAVAAVLRTRGRWRR